MTDETNWRNTLIDDRERKEVELCEIYARGFAHGTAGHNIRMIVAKLAAHLDALYQERDAMKDWVTDPKTSDFQYTTTGTYTAPLETTDTDGNVSQATKSTIKLSNKGRWR